MNQKTCFRPAFGSFASVGGFFQATGKCLILRWDDALVSMAKTKKRVPARRVGKKKGHGQVITHGRFHDPQMSKCYKSNEKNMVPPTPE